LVRPIRRTPNPAPMSGATRIQPDTSPKVCAASARSVIGPKIRSSTPQYSLNSSRRWLPDRDPQQGRRNCQSKGLVP
jgi:hypothetical protein